MRKISIRFAALCIALLSSAMAGLNGVSAQSPVDYDADDDGLIEIEWLEQLDAVRWDLDGDGFADDGANAERYAAAFPDAAEGMGCAEGCRGYELTRDLDFKSAGSYASGAVNSKWTSGNGWLPIGVNNKSPFRATLQGNDHSIANLYIYRDDNNQKEVIGLLGYNFGNLIRIRMVDVDITSEESAVGGLVGENAGSITSSYVTGSVSGYFSGGIAGGNNGNIESSYASGSVSGGFINVLYSPTSGIAGGLVGENTGSIASSHTTNSAVYGGGGYGGTGGLVGENTGSITSSHTINSAVYGGSFGGAGGLVGESGGSIAFSYANDSVIEGAYGSIGGLVGGSTGDITFSYANADVSGEGASAGGLVGYNGGSIIAGYATGKVSGEDAGGLVGWNVGNVTSGDITFSYATADVSGEWSAGGLVGLNGGSITSSYSTGSVSGNNAVGGFVGQNHAGFSYIDFNNPSSIKFSYTTGDVRIINNTDSTAIGGFIGVNDAKGDEEGEVFSNYWLRVRHSGLDGVGEGLEDGILGVSTERLQEPVGYTGIYVDWHMGSDGHDAWDFGTSNNYPVLKVDADGDGDANWWEFGKQHGRPLPAFALIQMLPNTPTPTDTPIPTATATHIPPPTDTPAPTSTPDPTATPVPPTQTPQVVVVVVTATPEADADAPSGGGCNSVGAVPAGAAANLMLLLAPLGIIGGVRYHRRVHKQ